jgi:RNA polymerase primary sigma factor
MRQFQDGFGLLMPEVATPTDDENRGLIRRAQAGDVGARNECMARNLPLVVDLLRRYTKRSDFPDLVQEGSLGVKRAIEKFDFRPGVKFGTYAALWVRQFARRYVGASDLIRIPAHIQHESAARESRATYDPGYRRRMAGMMKDKERVRAGVLSMSLEGDPEGIPLGHDDLDERLDDDDTMAAVDREMGRLPHRDAEIIRRRFGLDGRRRETLREIAEDIGLTRERVRQIERSTLRELGKVLARETA